MRRGEAPRERERWWEEGGEYREREREDSGLRQRGSDASASSSNGSNTWLQPKKTPHRRKQRVRYYFSKKKKASGDSQPVASPSRTNGAGDPMDDGKALAVRAPHDTHSSFSPQVPIFCCRRGVSLYVRYRTSWMLGRIVAGIGRLGCTANLARAQPSREPLSPQPCGPCASESCRGGARRCLSHWFLSTAPP